MTILRSGGGGRADPDSSRRTPALWASPTSPFARRAVAPRTTKKRAPGQTSTDPGPGRRKEEEEKTGRAAHTGPQEQLPCQRTVQSADVDLSWPRIMKTELRPRGSVLGPRPPPSPFSEQAALIACRPRMSRALLEIQQPLTAFSHWCGPGWVVLVRRPCRRSDVAPDVGRVAPAADGTREEVLPRSWRWLCEPIRLCWGSRWRLRPRRRRRRATGAEGDITGAEATDRASATTRLPIADQVGYYGWSGYHGWRGSCGWGGHYLGVSPYWRYGLGLGWGWGFVWCHGPGYFMAGVTGPLLGVAAVDTDVEPEHALVYLNGVLIGTADDFDGHPNYLHLEPGRYSLGFRLAGYRSDELDLDVSGGRIPVDLRLAPDPSRAPAPWYERPRGLPTRRFFGPTFGQLGAKTGRSEDVVLPQGKAHLDKHEYHTLTGRSDSALDLRATPPHAAVYLDGQSAGTATELARLQRSVGIPPGSHRIEVMAPEFQPRALDVPAAAGQRRELVVELDAGPRQSSRSSSLPKPRWCAGIRP